ncbi:MAG: BMP family ABC transporter substrate-binding protein [Oscillospiraceae bacterium]
MATNWLKKTAAALALCVMFTSVTACSGSDASGGTAEGTAETTAEATAEAEPVAKLGFIYNGSVDGKSFTSDCNDQRIAAQQYSNIESEYIENVNVGNYEKAVKMLVEDGCTHIVSGSPVYSHVINPVSQQYMNINFIDYGSSTRSVNIFAYTESIYQAAYIAGVAAAFNSESEKIGFVADPVMLYYVQCVDAAALGTQLVYSTSTLVTAFARADDEIRSAVDALAAKGCDVIISYTASGETVEYCNSKGIKVIGNLDYSEDAANYENLLMYFYSSRDSFYLSQYKAMELDDWQPESYMGTVGNGVVNISDALSAARDGTQDIMNKLIPKIASGTAYIFDNQLKDVNGTIRQREGVAMSTSDILALDWYVEGVDLSLDSFIESKSTVESGELVIKK